MLLTLAAAPPGRGPATLSPMTVLPNRVRDWLPALGLCLAMVLPGAAMADSHDPVAIAPDAARAGGASVATFALG